MPTTREIVKKEMLESAALDKAAREMDTVIVAEKKTLSKLIDAVGNVNLVEVLQNELGDPLTQYKNEEGVINPHKIPQVIYVVAISFKVLEIAREIDLGICVKHGVIFLFNGKYWEEISDEDIKKALSEIAVKMGLPYVSVARSAPFRVKLFEQFLSDGIAEAVTPDRDNILINLSNGTLVIDRHTTTLKQHDRDDFLTYMLKYPYDENATAPIFDNFLKEVLPSTPTKEALQEFVGYVFTRGFKEEKGAVLYGDGANGKSVFFEVIVKVIGAENMSFKGLGDLCLKGDKGNNHRAEIENKLINYASEMSPKGADFEIFKSLISSEPVSARRLYKDVYTFRNSAKLMFNANKLPSDTERTHGFFRRYMIIPFNVTIPEERQDKQLHKKITNSELSGVLNWAIIGLKRLLSNQRFTKSKEIDDALEDFKKQSNSALQFIEEYQLIKNEYEFVSNRDLYNSYTEFCNSSGYQRFNQNNFSKEMTNAGFISTQKKIASRNQRGFKIEFGG